MLATEDKELLATWVRKDNLSRSRDALLKETGPSNIERADALSDWLLREGWITRKEKLQGGTWQWDGLIWRDLDRLKSLLGVGSRSQRDEARSQRIEQAQVWLDGLEGEIERHLREALARAVRQLQSETSLKVEILHTRLDLLESLADWRLAQLKGTRRDFALYAGEHTKSISSGDWKWLENSFDLEDLGVSHFLPVIWLAGDAQLVWGDKVMNLAPVRCVAVSLDDLLRVTAINAKPDHWWLIENRASFERQTNERPPTTLIAWLPGRPSQDWLEAMKKLLSLAPAPLRVSADADPAGIDIAYTVGHLWRSQGLNWTPYRMGMAEWQATTQKWALNQHDIVLLKRLLAEGHLPESMRSLCQAMLAEGRKAEQEGWL